MTANVIQPSFAAGELSPGLAARVDLAKYHVGAAELTNFFVDYKGGVSSRQGTQFIGLALAGERARLYKFVFSATQQYVLVFTTGNIEFIRNPGGDCYPNGSNSGFVMSDATPDFRENVGTPYTADELPDLKFAQTADILQIAHPSHPRMLLRRFSDGFWDLTEAAIGAKIASPVNVTATITGLPANSTDPQATTYLYTVSAVDKNGEESTANWRTLVTGIDMATTLGSVTLAWDNVPAADYYNVYKSIPGQGGETPPFTSSFGFCGIAYGTRFVDSNIIPDFSKAPPQHTDPFSAQQIQQINVITSSSDWPVGSTVINISDPTGVGAYALAVLDNSKRGETGAIVDVFLLNAGDHYTSPTITASGGGSSFVATATISGDTEHPTSVVYHQQRLIVASTNSQPTGLYGSKVGFYDNFDVSNPVKDDDAFTFIVAAAEVNRILHMFSMPGGLVLFTNSGIQQLTGGSSNAQNPAAITPSSAVVVPQSYFGTSRVRPLVINKEILYVQDPGTNVQDLAYNLFTNVYEGADTTVLSSHLFYPHNIVDWDYQHTPHRIVWAVREDGILLSLTFLKEQEVIGWARHTTPGGLFESVTVVQEGGDDAVYFVVNRGGRRMVERLAARVFDQISHVWCLDSALSYQGPPTNVLSGLDHLEGYPVSIFGDGRPQGDTVVVGGSVHLSTAVSMAVAGLPYTCRMQTVQLDLGNEQATVQGKRKRVVAVSVRVRDTGTAGPVGIQVGTTFATSVRFRPNVTSTDDMKLPENGLVTADMRLIIDPSYNVHGQICIEQQEPLPVTVLGVIPEIVLGDTGR